MRDWGLRRDLRLLVWLLGGGLIGRAILGLLGGLASLRFVRRDWRRMI